MHFEDCERPWNKAATRIVYQIVSSEARFVVSRAEDAEGTNRQGRRRLKSLRSTPLIL